MSLARLRSRLRVWWRRRPRLAKILLVDRARLERERAWWERRAEDENRRAGGLSSRVADLGMVVYEQERRLDRVAELEAQVAELSARRDSLARELYAATQRADHLEGLVDQAALVFAHPDRALALAETLRRLAHDSFSRGASS